MSYQLILCGNIGKIDDDSSGDKGRVELVLISLSDLYFKLDSISVCGSGPSLSFISYFLLTT